MSLELDDRQRAMLAEMGVRVWQPRVARPAPDAAPQPEPVTVPAPAAAMVEPPVAHPLAAPAPAMRTPGPVSAPIAPVPVRAATEARRPTGIENMSWPALEAAVAGCTACKLCERRRNTVFGVGQPPALPGAAPRADWMIIGEAPGENEDLQGEPFVGQAGRLLDNMLRAMGLARERNVFIANVLKCRPPGNRNPEPEEVAQCEPYLMRQVELVQPRVILAMGRFAVQSLLRTQEPIGRLRGRPHQYQGVPVIVTYHPAYLLRNLPDKAKAWADLCLAMSLMDANGSGR
ncbi:MAG: uracil-DNA glycosylase [Burkholderiaceae bacterium]|nr:uracil-DNA glycosylase [Burkholderiaceae bacterium]